MESKQQGAFEAKLAEAQANQVPPKKNGPFWLAHHWPDDYHHRCVTIAGRPVCRRCLALHPLSLIVAVAFVANVDLWPAQFDPAMIWLLSIPATIAFSGEAIRMFPYSPKWQTGTTLLAALAFGRALGYELETRWHPFFWGPLAVFGGVWFLASWHGHRLNQLDQKLS